MYVNVNLLCRERIGEEDSLADYITHEVGLSNLASELVRMEMEKGWDRSD